MWIDHLQQVLRKGRELGVDLQLDPGRQIGETFEQPLDIGIGTLEAAQAQAPGDLRKFRGELPADLADMLQLAVVVFEMSGVHG